MKRWLVGVGLSIGLFAVTSLATPIRSMPGASFAGPQSQRDGVLRLQRGAPAHTITLATPDATERARLKAAPVADKRTPLKIGFTRNVPAGRNQVELSSLAWQALPDGKRAARFTIESPSAAAIRAELNLTGEATGLAFRFTGSGADAPVFGPYTWSEVIAAGRMSPILDGSIGTIEVETDATASLAGKTLILPRISHLVVSSAEIASGRLKAVPDIGASGACNIDVACIPNPSNDLLRASSATGQIAFTKPEGTFLCSGTLLNSTNGSGQPTQIPYFATANHCVGTASEAASMIFYWFFEAAACDSLAVPNFQTTVGGASMQFTSYDVDFTLVRMNQNPPSGVFLAGWDAGPVFPSANVIALHHPQGDLKKFSAGTSIDYAGDFDDIQNPPLFEPQGNYLRIRWVQGTTEVGSSGSGVFSRAQSGEYQVRGVLHGGGASCQTPTELDYYSRFDLAFPAISVFLAGVTQPEAGSNAIEYYNVDLDHYFMTSFPEETASIEAGGAGRGWVRTGYSFPIAINPSAASVCRFYGNPDINPTTGARWGPNSHFYTADAAECASVKLDPGWVYEAIAFNIRVPTSQACPAGTTPVFRTYNNGFTTNNSNHRYTTNPTIYQFMLTQQWSGEQTVMCAP